MAITGTEWWYLSIIALPEIFSLIESILWGRSVILVGGFGVHYDNL